MSAFNRFKEGLDKKLEPVLDTVARQINQAADSAQLSAVEFIKDDMKLGFVLRQIHGRLPLPIRFAVKEERFVDFCLRNRNRFVKKSDDDQFSA